MKSEFEINPVTGNMEIRMTGTMPVVWTCDVCGAEQSGYIWHIEDGKQACVTCASKPPK